MSGVAEVCQGREGIEEKTDFASFGLFSSHFLGSERRASPGSSFRGFFYK